MGEMAEYYTNRYREGVMDQKPTSSSVWIAWYQPTGERASILTAYTSKEAAQRACVDAALEYGLGVTSWTYDRKTHIWRASFKHVAFYVVERILNGVGD
jgi:hypothetical protein